LDSTIGAKIKSGGSGMKKNDSKKLMVKRKKTALGFDAIFRARSSNLVNKCFIRIIHWKDEQSIFVHFHPLSDPLLTRTDNR